LIQGSEIYGRHPGQVENGKIEVIRPVVKRMGTYYGNTGKKENGVKGNEIP
jgi:hypothetical protein